MKCERCNNDCQISDGCEPFSTTHWICLICDSTYCYEDNEKMKIETPEDTMESLKWSKEDLKKCKDYLIEWDKRNNSFYKNLPAMSKKFDMAEREHFRNCVNYWDKKHGML